MKKIFKFFYRIYEFLFDRWEIEIAETGTEQVYNLLGHRPKLPYTKWKYTNKFTGEVKYEKEFHWKS